MTCSECESTANKEYNNKCTKHKIASILDDHFITAYIMICILILFGLIIFKQMNL